MSNKQSEDSAVDISASSSRFENAFTPSASTSTEELCIANLNDEDGFEKVAVSEATDAALASKQGVEDSNSPQQTSNQPQTPTGTLDETVRRLSLEDTDMTTDESEPATQTMARGNHPGDISPHPEDKPAPLFAKSSDPNKTPTANSPEPPTSPSAKKARPESSHLEVQSFQMLQDDTMHESQAEPKTSDDAPVVGDYLKIMFVDNRVVPTILVNGIS